MTDAAGARRTARFHGNPQAASGDPSQIRTASGLTNIDHQPVGRASYRINPLKLTDSRLHVYGDRLSNT